MELSRTKPTARQLVVGRASFNQVLLNPSIETTWRGSTEVHLTRERSVRLIYTEKVRQVVKDPLVSKGF